MIQPFAVRLQRAACVGDLAKMRIEKSEKDGNGSKHLLALEGGIDADGDPLAMLPVQNCLANKADFQGIQRVNCNNTSGGM